MTQAFFLVLVLQSFKSFGTGMVIVPEPYPSLAACEAAGAAFNPGTKSSFDCISAPLWEVQ